MTEERPRAPGYSSLGRSKREGSQRHLVELGPKAIDRLRQLKSDPFTEDQGNEDRSLIGFSLSKNRAEIIQHTKVLIVALQEALDHDPKRHHNSGPPALWSDSPDYLNDVKALVKELRRLNRLLEENPTALGANGAAREVERQIKTFADNYVPLFAKGTACMTLAVMADLLGKMGIGSAELHAVIEMVLKAAGKG